MRKVERDSKITICPPLIGHSSPHRLQLILRSLVWSVATLLPPVSYANNADFSYVDQALPALVSGGEAMNSSHQWYRAHSVHNGFASSFNNDASLLLLTSPNSPVELWDTNQRKTIASFSGSGAGQKNSFVDISANGKFVAINVGERIEVRDVEGKLLQFSVPAISGGVANFSPDSKWFASAIDGKRLDLWNVANKKRSDSLIDHSKRVSSIAFSHDSKYMVSTDISGKLNVWNLHNKQLLHYIKEDDIPFTTVQFSPIDYSFITVDKKGGVKLWDAESKSQIHHYNTPKIETLFTNAAAFSPDGKTIAVSLNQADNKSTLLFFSSLLGGKPLFVHNQARERISNLAFKPAGKSLIVSLTSREVKVFDVQSRQYIDAFGGQILKANTTRLSPDGNLIATGTIDGDIQLWDANRKVLKYSLKGRNQSIEHVSFSQDGQNIIVGDNRGTVTVWDRRSNQRKFSVKAHKVGHAIASMSPDNKYLATASSESSIIRLWDIEANKPLHKFIGHHNDITDLAYSSDGKFIASSSKDATIKLWDTSNNSLAQSFIGNEKTSAFLSLAFSPDGRHLAGGTDAGSSHEHVIEIWDIQDKKHIRTLDKHEGAVTSIRFNKQGNRLVSGAKDGTIKVWNMNSGLTEHTLNLNDKENKPTKSVHAVDLTKDGRNVLTVTTDGATYLWDVQKNQKAYTLLGGPRGTWVSENHIRQRFVRGDDGSLKVKSGKVHPPAQLAPTGLASEDKLILSTPVEPIKISTNGGSFQISIRNIGELPSFWLRAKQIDKADSAITIFSNQLTKLDVGRKGVLDLKLLPHNPAMLKDQPLQDLEMEIVTKAGSHFPLTIPLEFVSAASAKRANPGRNRPSLTIE